MLGNYEIHFRSLGEKVLLVSFLPSEKINEKTINYLFTDVTNVLEEAIEKYEASPLVPGSFESDIKPLLGTDDLKLSFLLNFKNTRSREDYVCKLMYS